MVRQLLSNRALPMKTERGTGDAYGSVHQFAPLNGEADGERGAARSRSASPPSRTEMWVNSPVSTEQIARLRQLADTAKLDPDFAEKFLNFIVTEVIRHHEAIRQIRG